MDNMVDTATKRCTKESQAGEQKNSRFEGFFESTQPLLVLRTQPLKKHFRSNDVAIASDQHAAAILKESGSQLRNLAPALRQQSRLIRNFIDTCLVDHLQSDK